MVRFALLFINFLSKITLHGASLIKNLIVFILVSLQQCNISIFLYKLTFEQHSMSVNPHKRASCSMALSTND